MDPGSTIVRHGRSIARFWSSSLAAEMEYQLNLLIEVAATLITLAGSCLLYTSPSPRDRG